MCQKRRLRSARKCEDRKNGNSNFTIVLAVSQSLKAIGVPGRPGSLRLSGRFRWRCCYLDIPCSILLRRRAWQSIFMFLHRFTKYIYGYHHPEPAGCFREEGGSPHCHLLIRRLGVSADGIRKENPWQHLDLFSDTAVREKEQHIQRAILEIRRRFEANACGDQIISKTLLQGSELFDWRDGYSAY